MELRMMELYSDRLCSKHPHLLSIVRLYVYTFVWCFNVSETMWHIFRQTVCLLTFVVWENQ